MSLLVRCGGYFVFLNRHVCSCFKHVCICDGGLVQVCCLNGVYTFTDLSIPLLLCFFFACSEILCLFTDVLPCFGYLPTISDPQQDGKTTKMCTVQHNNGGQA